MTSGQYLQGAGRWATTWSWQGTGDCFRAVDTSPYLARTVQGGGVSGLSVDGTSASAGSCALHFGDILQYGFDIAVTNFAGTGDIGIHPDNQNFQTEQATGRAYLYNCTQDVVFDCGGATTSNGSFDRGDFSFYIDKQGFSNSIVFQNGAFITGGRLRVFGNYNSSNTPFTAAVLTLTGESPGGHSPSSFSGLAQCEIDVNVESDEALASTFQTINYGSTSNTITGCNGNMSFGSGFLFAESNVTSVAAQFTFLGPVTGDTTLGQQTVSNRFSVSGETFLFSQVFMGEVAAAPGTPAGGGFLYVDATGHLHYLGPSGTNTTLAGP